MSNNYSGGLNILFWSSNIPVLNIIENIWHKIKAKLRNDPETSLSAPKNKTAEIWSII